MWMIKFVMELVYVDDGLRSLTHISSTVAQQQDLLRQQEILRQRMMEFQQQQEQFEREKKSMLSKLQEKLIERDQQLEEARYLVQAII